MIESDKIITLGGLSAYHDKLVADTVKVFKGTSSTAAATAAKAVVCPSFTAADLVQGATIVVTPSVTNTAAVADLTMNVNGTGAMPLKAWNNNTVVSLPHAGQWCSGMPTLCVYTGQYWVCYLNINTNTTYSVGSAAYLDNNTNSNRLWSASVLAPWVRTQISNAIDALGAPLKYAGSGTEFPQTAEVGDVFLRTDTHKEYVYAPGGNPGHEYVDLGLPSGTLWATMNVGANSVTDYGNYYQYGNGATQYNYEDDTYTGEENPLATSADTAAQVWGEEWHMPTQTLIEELINNTTYEWITINGVSGGKFTAQNGNYIFIPAAGYYDERGRFVNANEDGRVWSSTPFGSYDALHLLSNDGRITMRSYDRHAGYSVRPVLDSLSSGSWVEFGDEGSYALKSISIAGLGVLEGGGTLTESRAITHKTSGVTAGTYGSATQVPKITVDSYGHVTGVTATNITDAKVTQTATTTNANYEVLFSVTADNTTRTEGARKNSNLKFNPSTGNLQATQLNGVAIGSSPKFTDTNTTYKLTIGSTTNGDSTNGVSLGTLTSGTAASGGTALSLVTTGEKYTWNGKQDALTFNTAPSSTNKVATMADIPTAVTNIFSSTANGLAPSTASGNVTTAETSSARKYLCDDGKWRPLPEGSWKNGTVTSTAHTITVGSGYKSDGSTAITATSSSAASPSVTLGDSGVTAGAYGDTAAQTPAYGATFKVPSISVNAKGIVTAVGEHTVKIPASDNTNTTYKVTINGAASGGGSTNLATFYAPTTVGTSGQYLKSSGSGAPTWANMPTTLPASNILMSYTEFSTNQSNVTTTLSVDGFETKLFKNTASADRTISITTTNTVAVDGNGLSLTVGAGKYCEISFMKIGTAIYVRSAIA